jgi:hypothetical protein
MLISNNKRVGDDEYHKNLRTFDTHESGLHMFHYLMQLDVSKFNFQKVPTSDWKITSMISHIKPVTFCLLKHLYRDTNEFLNTDECWITFTEKYGDSLKNYSRNKLSAEISSFLSCKPEQKKINGKNIRCYILTTDEIKQILVRTMRVSMEQLDYLISEFPDIEQTAGGGLVRENCML